MSCSSRLTLQSCGGGVGVVKCRSFFGWSRISNNTGSRSRIFCPTPDVQLDHFLDHTPKLGIPVEMVQFLSKLLLKQISCCVPRFTLILTAKYHSLYVKESEILSKSESGVGYFTSNSATMVTKTKNIFLAHFRFLKKLQIFLLQLGIMHADQPLPNLH